MKNALFYVESPLQLMCAAEAAHDFKIKDYILLIRFSGAAKNDRQIVDLLDRLDLNGVNVKPIRVRSQGRGIFDLVRFIVHCFWVWSVAGRFEYFFIGSYVSKFSAPIKLFKNKVILLDDGNKTLEIQSNFQPGKALDLFTMFDLTPKGDQIICKNHFSFLKARLQKSKEQYAYSAKYVAFLGGGLIETGVVSKEYYLASLAKIAKEYAEKGEKLIYYPHRKEIQSNLKQIMSIDNLEIQYLDYPIELLGLKEKKQLPGLVISFYSSALITLNSIYGVEIKAYRIREDEVSNDHIGEVAAVYADYDELMEVVNL